MAATLGVERVARAGGDESALDITTQKGHVADEVQKFVSRRLVLIIERGKIAEFACVYMGCAEFLGHIIQSLLRHLCLIDDKGILQVATIRRSGSISRTKQNVRAEAISRG